MVVLELENMVLRELPISKRDSQPKQYVSTISNPILYRLYLPQNMNSQTQNVIKIPSADSIFRVKHEKS